LRTRGESSSNKMAHQIPTSFAAEWRRNYMPQLFVAHRVRVLQGKEQVTRI
jgi:hypothetical protein